MRDLIERAPRSHLGPWRKIWERLGYLADKVEVTRYRWLAGGRTSKRYRKCDVFDISIGARVGAVDSGELLANELARPQSLPYRLARPAER